MRPHEVHTTVAAAKKHAIKKIKVDIKRITGRISKYQKDLEAVRAFKPGKAA